MAQENMNIMNISRMGGGDRKKIIKIQLHNDNFENAKKIGIPHAQLIIADLPYNLGNLAYASNPSWYIDGDNKKGESKLAGKQFFDTDDDFKIGNFFDFCTRYLKKEPTGKLQQKGKSSDAPAMIVFCAFEQMQLVIDEGKKHGLNHAYPLVFIKNFSAQVLKANMKIVGATEYAVVLYRDKLPKFRNIGEDGKGHMVFNWFKWERDDKKKYPKIHPTQKPVNVLKRLIEIFTDEGDVVIDPVAGSGSTLRACAELNRSCYGFEIKKNFVKDAKEKMLKDIPEKWEIDLSKPKNEEKAEEDGGTETEKISLKNQIKFC
jgi:site-specific DNA-methyltransferase (adenine-specific)